jgi:hypothetical protein
MNLYKQNYLSYLEAGYALIPDRFRGKTPLIKGWSDYCSRLPTFEEALNWSNNFSESNCAVCLGKASGIIALDLDEERKEILELVLPLLPASPVVKVGAKGETRFFRYKGETTESVSFDGAMVIEVLSTGKKTTIPPSVHPNGSSYYWKNKAGLLDVKKESLPLLPPFLLSQIKLTLEGAFGRGEIKSTHKGNKLSIESTGRNSLLCSLAAKLISERVDLNQAIKELVSIDKKEHADSAYFTDPEEHRHTEAFSNALTLYVSVLNSINAKHYRNNTFYEPPMITSGVEHSIKEVERLGKSLKQGKPKKSRKTESTSVKKLIKTWS